MIGTNNLGSGHLPEPTSRGVVAVARWLLENTRGKLVLVKLLPRGDHSKLIPLCPPRCADDGQPYQTWKPAIDLVNEHVGAAAAELTAAFGARRFELLDCNAPFAAPDAGVRPELMPDMLHVRTCARVQVPAPLAFASTHARPRVSPASRAPRRLPRVGLAPRVRVPPRHGSLLRPGTSPPRSATRPALAAERQGAQAPCGMLPRRGFSRSRSRQMTAAAPRRSGDRNAPREPRAAPLLPHAPAAHDTPPALATHIYM